MVVYVLALNNSTVVIALSDSWVIALTSGQLLISAFVIGLLFSFLFALYLGVRHFLRERGFESRERQRITFYEGMSKARGISASGDYSRAAVEWEKQIKRDPTHSIARVELARCLEMRGEAREALRVLDGARAVESNNIEVLMAAANLHRVLGNRTAAIDNLALVLMHQPTALAALTASQLSEELGRYDDALEYLSRAQQLNVDESKIASERARIKYALLLREYSNDSTQLIDGLRALARQDPPYIPAILKLAECEAARGKTEEAARLELSVSRLTEDSIGWRKAVERWLVLEKPERALAALRSAISESSKRTRIYAELDLIRLYLILDMFEEAKKALETNQREFEAAAAHSLEVRQQLGIFKLIIAAQDEDHVQVRNEKRRLLGFGSSSISDLTRSNGIDKIDADAPSPSLSTP